MGDRPRRGELAWRVARVLDLHAALPDRDSVHGVPLRCDRRVSSRPLSRFALLRARLGVLGPRIPDALYGRPLCTDYRDAARAVAARRRCPGPAAAVQPGVPARTHRRPDPRRPLAAAAAAHVRRRAGRHEAGVHAAAAVRARPGDAVVLLPRTTRADALAGR